MSVEETENLLERAGTSLLERRRRVMVNKTADGRRQIEMWLVLEDLRVLYYVMTLILLGTGYVLTMLYVDFDHTEIIMRVFGGTNACTYLDWAPSTYVVPVMWVPTQFVIIL